MNPPNPGTPTDLTERPAPPPRSWEDIVAASNGQLMFVPSEFKEQVEQWHKKRMAFKKELEAVSKTEVEINNMFQNLMFALRSYYAENGVDYVWTADVGFQAEALKEDKFIFTIEPNERNG